MKKLLIDIVYRVQFEQLMAFSIFAILGVAMFTFGADKETLNLILGAFIGYFTNHVSNKIKESKEEKLK